MRRSETSGRAVQIRSEPVSGPRVPALPVSATSRGSLPLQVADQLKAQSPDNTAFSLVGFITNLLETVTPALEYFDMGPAIIRDTPISIWAFAQYVGSVSLYALVYTTIALLLGLILFEDRDLA